MPRPHTTFESTDITGKIFEHVEHVGSGLPSDPRGMSGLAGGGLEELVEFGRDDGRARKTLVSGSSLTFSCSREVFLDFPSFFLILVDKEVDERVNLLVDELEVSAREAASSVRGGVTSCSLPWSVPPTRDASNAFCRRVEMIDLKGVPSGEDSLLPEDDLWGDGESGTRYVTTPVRMSIESNRHTGEGADTTLEETSVSSSISPSFGTSAASVRSRFVSSSSLSSESSSSSCKIAYTPRRVLRSLMLVGGLFLFPSESSQSVALVLGSVSDSEPEWSSTSC